jgi:hypothetical protein
LASKRLWPAWSACSAPRIRTAGGLPILLEIARQLPPEYPAAVVMVIHIGSHESVLPQLL